MLRQCICQDTAYFVPAVSAIRHLTKWITLLPRSNAQFFLHSNPANLGTCLSIFVFDHGFEAANLRQLKTSLLSCNHHFRSFMLAAMLDSSTGVFAAPLWINRLWQAIFFCIVVQLALCWYCYFTTRLNEKKVSDPNPQRWAVWSFCPTAALWEATTWRCISNIHSQEEIQSADDHAAWSFPHERE